MTLFYKRQLQQAVAASSYLRYLLPGSGFSLQLPRKSRCRLLFYLHVLVYLNLVMISRIGHNIFSAMQNDSATAAISSGNDSPWIIWQHPASAIAFLIIICSICVIVAAFIANACLPVQPYNQETLKPCYTRPRISPSSENPIVRQYQQPGNQLLPCKAEV